MQSTEENLGTVLAQLARRTPDGRLVSAAAVGVVAALVAVVLKPPAWFPMLAAGVCLLSFGTWGITDRVLHEGHEPVASRQRLLRVTRVIAVVLGICGGLALALGVFALAMGNWIS
jgi:hypothetical protein